VSTKGPSGCHPEPDTSLDYLAEGIAPFKTKAPARVDLDTGPLQSLEADSLLERHSQSAAFESPADSLRESYWRMETA